MIHIRFYLRVSFDIPIVYRAGIKVKVIEALACGIPVIGTDIAFEGLPPLFNSFMLIAETPKDYIRCMECLNMNNR